MCKLFATVIFSLIVQSCMASDIGLGPVELVGTATYQWTAGQQIQETLFANSTYIWDLPYAPVSIDVQTESTDSYTSYQGEPTELMPLGTGCGAWTGTITIDGVTGGPPCSGGNTATWEIGEYAGLLQIFDPSGDLIASANTQELLYGPHDDNYVDNAQGDLSSIDCTIGIGPVPEPSTWAMMLLGVYALCCIGAYRSYSKFYRRKCWPEFSSRPLYVKIGMCFAGPISLFLAVTEMMDIVYRRY